MKTCVKEHLAYWFPVYVWAVLIFYFSSGSLTPPPPSSIGRVVVTVSDYYKHMLGYGFLTFLLWRAFHNSKFRSSCISAVIITFFYGGFNELYQLFVPGRNPSLFDAFSNFIGSIIVQPLLMLYKKIPKRKQEKVS